MHRRTSKVSEAVIRRLPRYHRYLEEFIKVGIKRISSQEPVSYTHLPSGGFRKRR